MRKSRKEEGLWRGRNKYWARRKVEVISGEESQALRSKALPQADNLTCPSYNTIALVKYLILDETTCVRSKAVAIKGCIMCNTYHSE